MKEEEAHQCSIWVAQAARSGYGPVTLLGDLYAFFQEHRRRGDLDTAVDGDRIWMTCTCGARIERDADRD